MEEFSCMMDVVISYTSNTKVGEDLRIFLKILILLETKYILHLVYSQITLDYILTN